MEILIIVKQEVVEFKESWDAARLEEEEVFTGGGSWGKYQQRLWDLFDKPHSSLAARMVALTSSLFIFLSVTILTLATLPGRPLVLPDGLSGQEKENIFD